MKKFQENDGNTDEPSRVGEEKGSQSSPGQAQGISETFHNTTNVDYDVRSGSNTQVNF